MVIKFDEIKGMFQQLVEDKISREKVADWAYHLREKYDDGGLIFEPKDSENRIWNSILFLEGIDLQISPNSYLHSKTDIQFFFIELLR
jgi:hypothetical protein